MSLTSTPVPSLAQRANSPIIAIDMPVLFEDEGYEEMGESVPHSATEAIVRFGLMAHLRRRPELTVLSDMNLHYHPLKRKAYVSPDVMVVQPHGPLDPQLASYTIGEDGPMPILTVEVLSDRTYQQGDLKDKMEVYRENGVSEYIVIDVTRRFLLAGLQLRRLQADGAWAVFQDADGGVTSDLGFRLRILADGAIRVFDTRTGRGYPRPEEADDEAEARLTAERRADAETVAREAAEAEAARLREQIRRLTESPRTNGN